MPINFQFGGKQADSQFQRKEEEGRRISQFSTAASTLPAEMRTLPNLAAIAGEFGVLDPLKAVEDFLKLQDQLTEKLDGIKQPAGTVPTSSVLPAAKATGTTGVLPTTEIPPLGRTSAGEPMTAQQLLPLLPPGFVGPTGVPPTIGTPGKEFFPPGAQFPT